MSDKQSYRQFKVGDRVSVKQTDTAYDDESPVTPDMKGTIKAFPAKVYKVKGPLFDSGDYFAYIVFDNNVRVGVNICNLRKLRDKLS
jgi:hypothetical protein